jgi:hypothetical protein
MQLRIWTPCRIALLLAWLPLAGCQQAASREGLLEQTTSEAHLSSHQLRVLVRDYVLRSAAEIEQGADQILARTSDPRIRKNALRWKINAISAAFRAATRPDPLAAYLDLWILNRQTIDLFSRPAAEPLFGPHTKIALNTCHELEVHLQHIDAVLGTELPLGPDFVQSFATDFPIANLYFERESLSSRYIDAVEEPTRELLYVASRMQENLEAMQRISLVFAEHLPKQARWEAELLLLDATAIEAIARPLDDFRTVSESIGRIAATTESLPPLVVQECRQSLADLDRMRMDSTADLQDERVAVLNAVSQERAIVLDALRDEREEISAQLDAELDAVLLAMDTVSYQRTEEVGQAGRELVDHFFWRLTQLGAAIALAALVALSAFLWRRRRVSRAAPEPADIPQTIRFEARQQPGLQKPRRAA